jgi:hypothetical protein
MGLAALRRQSFDRQVGFESLHQVRVRDDLLRDLTVSRTGSMDADRTGHSVICSSYGLYERWRTAAEGRRPKPHVR